LGESGPERNAATLDRGSGSAESVLVSRKTTWKKGVVGREKGKRRGPGPWAGGGTANKEKKKGAWGDKVRKGGRDLRGTNEQNGPARKKE